MKAYKGFKKDLTCLGYKFNEDGINKTDQANCRKNGFHCAENPMDCLDYYSDWKTQFITKWMQQVILMKMKLTVKFPVPRCSWLNGLR